MYKLSFERPIYFFATTSGGDVDEKQYEIRQFSHKKPYSSGVRLTLSEFHMLHLAIVNIVKHRHEKKNSCKQFQGTDDLPKEVANISPEKVKMFENRLRGTSNIKKGDLPKTYQETMQIPEELKHVPLSKIQLLEKRMRNENIYAEEDKEEEDEEKTQPKKKIKRESDVIWRDVIID